VWRDVALDLGHDRSRSLAAPGVPPAQWTIVHSGFVNLVLLCAAGGRHGEAESLYLRAITLLEGPVARTHPTLLACRKNYAALVGPG
jgi:hypothetical protein